MSSKGLVWSLYRQIVLKPFPNKHGYLYVGLYKDGKRSNVYIHQLVARAFHGECPPGQQVRHLNDKNQDNAATNLAYGTHKDDMLDRARNNAAKKCPKGHPRDGIRKNGRRYCKTCNRKRSDAYYQANRKEVLAKAAKRYQRSH